MKPIKPPRPIPTPTITSVVLTGDDNKTILTDNAVVAWSNN